MKLIIPIILPQHAVDLPQSFSTEIILEILTRKKKKKKNELRNWFTTNKYTKQERSNYYDITYQFLLLPFTTPTKYISSHYSQHWTRSIRFESTSRFFGNLNFKRNPFIRKTGDYFQVATSVVTGLIYVANVKWLSSERRKRIHRISSRSISLKMNVVKIVQSISEGLLLLPSLLPSFSWSLSRAREQGFRHYLPSNGWRACRQCERRYYTGGGGRGERKKERRCLFERR